MRPVAPRHPLLFFLTATATPEIYTLSLHDALPISAAPACRRPSRRTALLPISTRRRWPKPAERPQPPPPRDRKSTRLNSSHTVISYAVFCLKKKNTGRLHQRVTDGRADAFESALNQ